MKELLELSNPGKLCATWQQNCSTKSSDNEAEYDTTG